jgi:hypothetical protein
MNFTGVQLTLLIGPEIAVPAPLPLAHALRSAEVTIADKGPSGFQLQFQMSRSSLFLPDYELLPLLAPFNRVVLIVTLNAIPRVIMDGLITTRQLVPGQGGQPDLMSVTGEDISVAMDLHEVSMAYPGLNDCEIAGAIFLEYPEYGLLPMVIPTPVNESNDPLDEVNQQAATDRAYLNMLAERNGYVFYVRPGEVPLTNVAYFGPPIRIGLPQSALTVNQFPGTNVDSIQFSYDALAAEIFTGDVQDTLGADEDDPIVVFDSLREPPLALRPALLFNQPFTKRSLFDAQGMDPLQAMTKAQGLTNLSTDRVLVANGEIDVFRYGALLTAPGLVGVRGAGYDHDGLYYVSSVTHRITPASYKQSFSISREGLGSTTPVVVP